jgi:hypothetical protein
MDEECVLGWLANIILEPGTGIKASLAAITRQSARLKHL